MEKLTFKNLPPQLKHIELNKPVTLLYVATNFINHIPYARPRLEPLAEHIAGCKADDIDGGFYVFLILMDANGAVFVYMMMNYSPYAMDNYYTDRIGEQFMIKTRGINPQTPPAP